MAHTGDPIPADPPTTGMPSTDKPRVGRLERAHDTLTSPGGRLIRYALVLAIVTAAIIGSLSGWFLLCETVVDPDGTTTTCSGPDLTSAGVLAAVLLVLLLLWPDLSEFSAFGVTVKKLVIDVKNKVSEVKDTVSGVSSKVTTVADDVSDVARDVRDTSGTARRIDERTTASQRALEALQASVTTGDFGLSRQLDGIESSLGQLHERSWSRDSPVRQPPALNRWYPDDQDELEYLAGRLFRPEIITERASTVRNIIDDARLGSSDEALDGAQDSIAQAGLLITLYRDVDSAQAASARSENVDRREVADILRLIEQIILSLIDGRPVYSYTARTAIAILWLLKERQDEQRR